MAGRDTFKRSREVGQLAAVHISERPDESGLYTALKRLGSLPHSSPVTAIRVSAEERPLVYCASSIRALRYRGEEYENRSTVFLSNNDVSTIGLRSDGRLLAVGTHDGQIIILDPANKTILRRLSGHKASVRCCEFLADKLHLLSTSDDCTWRLWDISSGSQTHFSKDSADFIRAGCASLVDEGLYAVGSYDHQIRVCRVGESEPILKLNHSCPVEAISFLHGDQALVSVGGDAILRIWDITNGGRLQAELAIHHKSISTLVVSGNGKYLLTGSLDRHVKVTCLATLQVVHSYSHKAAVMSLAASSDSRLLFVGLSNGDMVIRKYAAAATTAGRANRRVTGSLKPADPEVYSYFLTKSTILPPFDRKLRAFRYREALDTIIKIRNPNHFGSALGELNRRNGLIAALSGRNEDDLVPLVRLIVRHIQNPRFSTLLIDCAFHILDIYSSVIGTSPNFDQALHDLKNVLGQHIKAQRELIELGGSISAILSPC